MIDPNAPAYPNARAYACGPIDGMTIRATMAMHFASGWLASSPPDSPHPADDDCEQSVARLSVKMADALIDELNKTEVKP